MSIYTPPPPDQYAVLEGVNHFGKLYPGEVPAYGDVHTWSRSWSEEPGSDPQFLDADTAALADAVFQALDRAQKKAQTTDWRHRKPRVQGAVAERRPAVGVLPSPIGRGR